MVRKMALPRRFYYIDSSAGTVSVRGRGGRFKGRKASRGTGDRTRARRVKRDYDVNHDGKTDFYGGTIYGRTAAVRASKRARGYERRV